MSESKRRNARLRQALRLLRRQTHDDVRGRVRRERDDRPAGVGDSGDVSGETVQTDIDFALIQMRAATLARIDAALSRLGAGEYGACFECGDEIAESRLKALPFAVRCRDCEAIHEQDQARGREVALRGLSPFSNPALYAAASGRS